MEDILKRTIESNRLIISDSNPYFPGEAPFRGDSLKRKLKSAYFSSSEERTRKLQRERTDGVKLLTAGNDFSGDTNDKLLSTAERRLVEAGNIATISSQEENKNSFAMVSQQRQQRVPQPQWHAHWELSAVISGHLGWVRSIAFDPSNEWFVTGSADRTIKIWDLAKCCAGAEDGLKLTLTGHVHTVRGLAVSPRHPYLFSAGEDKLVKCWDLEYNKVIRHYHGHLSGVFCLDLHPVLDLLFTGGRDSVCRVWDMRTKTQVHVLGGHTNAVSSMIVNGVDPQVITGSHDSTIKLWDLAAGRSMSTLTHHKKAVRSLCANTRDFTFLSGGADNVKKWQCRDGKFIRNFTGHSTPINAVAINEDGVAVSCGDNGSIHFWDYNTGYCFQKTRTIVQPGSLDAESGIYASSFDLSGSRLLTCEADKTIKIWKESDHSSEETDPVDMKSWARECLALKRY